MERESFEDDGVAEILNKHFVSIKVDREERPDIDNIYMGVCQLMTGSGGWPLSLFLDANRRPFAAGTYFPKTARYGVQGFTDILKNIAQIYKEDRKKVGTVTEQIYKSISKNDDAGESREVSELADEVFGILNNNFDSVYGGMRGAPKFPSPHNIYFLLRYAVVTGNKAAVNMLEKTLQCMVKGGIFDHIGYGFCRYSTDEKWLTPHFEKMLYDNALLCIAYIEAYQLTKNEIYKTVAENILEFTKNEMTSPYGGFYTAIDADTNGVEGKTYLWSRNEILEALGEKEGARFCNEYDISAKGNFENQNIPNLIGKNFRNMGSDRLKLLEIRNKRSQPSKDDKILTSLNGMMIAAYSIAGRVFGNSEYIECACSAIGFICGNLYKNGRLFARYRDSETGIDAFADDYAYFIWGLLEAYQATCDKKYLGLADELNKVFIKFYWDEVDGGFFLNSSDGEQLIIRPKDFYDGAVPSANSVSAHNFKKLELLMELPEYEGFYRRICEKMSSGNPFGSVHGISAVFFELCGGEITLAGNEEDNGYLEMLELIQREFLPLWVIKYDNTGERFKIVNNAATAYICHNFKCSPPITDLTSLKQELFQRCPQSIIH